LSSVKVVVGCAASIVFAVSLLPVVLSSGDTAPPPTCSAVSGHVGVILETIRTVESGGDYKAESRSSSASGAYQFVDGTWASYGGYRRASAAPADVQDAKAALHLAAILDRHDGDVTAVPVVWYLGHLPAATSPTWNRVPAGGNVLTPREYQTRWLSMYRQILGRHAATDPDPTSIDSAHPTPGSCVGGRIDPVIEGWSLPGPPDMILGDVSVLTQPHHTYPAWDWIIPINTPIYAVRAGRVVNVHQWAHNWWDRGCGSNPTGCVPCGVGLTIVDSENTHWAYCHATSLTISVGDDVAAGDQVMWSGNTGRSGTPHLHLEIRTPDGTRRCPQPLLLSLAQGHLPQQSSLPVSGCWFG
jgi:hypothetical protein